MLPLLRREDVIATKKLSNTRPHPAHAILTSTRAPRKRPKQTATGAIVTILA